MRAQSEASDSEECRSSAGVVAGGSDYNRSFTAHRHAHATLQVPFLLMFEPLRLVQVQAAYGTMPHSTKGRTLTHKEPKTWAVARQPPK
jgi:hypothetical protein